MSAIRCNTCKTVLHEIYAPLHEHADFRRLTQEETERYVQVGHEAFDDLVAVKDASGGIVRYDVVLRGVSR